MEKLRQFTVMALIAGTVIGFNARTEARPPHLKVFAATYLQVAARNKMTCTVCHAVGMGNKTTRNNYGEALTKHIVKGERDEARIKAALEETEPEPSAVPGKTFGDLLKLGLLPATRAADDPLDDSLPSDAVHPEN